VTTPLEQVRLSELVKEIVQRKGANSIPILSVTNTGFQPSLDVFDKQVFSADTSSYKVVEPGDIAYNPTRIGVGSVALLATSKSGAISPMYIVLRCNERVLPGFLHRFLKSHPGRTQIQGKSVNAVRPQLRFRDLQEIFLWLPHLPEQRHYLDLLEEVDDLAERRSQSDNLTNRIASQLHRQMFSPEMAVAGAWPSVALGNECVRLTVGHVGSMASQYVENGVPFLRSQNVRRGRLDLENVQHVSSSFAATISKSKLSAGDVVSVRSGKPGTSAVVPDGIEEANCADLIVMSPSPNINPHFLAELLNQRLGDQEELQHSVGSAQKHFNIGEARKIEFHRPPRELQDTFAAKLQIIDDMRDSQNRSRVAIKAVADSLEQRFFARSRAN
jgi:restriction endonuclease S subunit